MSIESSFSPLTNSKNIEIVESLNVKKIKLDYLNKYKTDVSKFFKDKNQVNIFRCNDTGYRFYLPFNLAGDGMFYEAIQNDGAYYSKWKKEYEIAKIEILKLNKTDSKILDIGCGFGFFIKEINNLGYGCVGLEYSEKAVQNCLNQGLKVYKESIEDHTLKFKGQYDIVCAFQVLEHIPNVNSFIESCLKCLKPYGILILAVPNNEPFYAGYHNYAISNVPPHHMGLWNLDTFKKIQTIFNIKLEDYKYDLKISFPYYLFFKSKYLLRKFIFNSGNLSTIISSIFALFLFPFEIVNLSKLKEKVLFGTIITIFKKNN